MLPAPSLPLVYRPAEALPVNQAASRIQLAILPDVHCTTSCCLLQSGTLEDTTAPGSEGLTWLPHPSAAEGYLHLSRKAITCLFPGSRERCSRARPRCRLVTATAGFY